MNPDGSELGEPSRPLREAGPVALADMSVPQLTEMFGRLEATQEHAEKLSGICGTLKGLVLAEVKSKIGHGNYLPWLKDHFPASRKTAAQYLRAASEFVKCNPKLHLKTLRSDLLTTMQAMHESQIDLSHPLVQQVALWSKGRTFSQLYLDLGEAQRGGDTSWAPRKTPTAEELHDVTLEGWRLLANEATDRAFGGTVFKSEWDRLTTREVADLADQLYAVVAHFRDAIKARKGSKS